MDIERLTDHIWNNHRSSRPSFNDLFRALFIIFLDFRHQVVVDKGAFF